MMETLIKVKQQVQLAEIAASLFKRGHKELASDIVLLTSSYNGNHVLFDDTDLSSVFMKTLHELLEELGFKDIMRVSKDRAESLQKISPTFNSQSPHDVYPMRTN